MHSTDSVPTIVADSVPTIVESIIGELVNDGITIRQQKESTSDDPVD
jgi:hypothetical protein